jgi:acetylornithine deacetylase/succinyl-diaminopimelate desuccinylase-like protein
MSEIDGQAVLARVGLWVATRREELIGEWADWVRRPSVSRDGTGFPAATSHAADLVRRCGLAPEVIETGGHPLVVGTADGPAHAPHVLIYGHYDVQPPGPLGEWHTPPFEPSIRDGRMYGRGTGDNKGQHLAQLLALRALRETAGTGGLPCRVTFVLDGEEEIGSPNLAAAIGARFGPGTLSRPDLGVWSDGPVHESGRATVVLGVRGVVTFELRASGANSPLHSGNWGGVAPNPAWRLVHLLTSMRAADGSLLIDGAHAGVTPPSVGEQAALDALPADVPSILRQIGVDAMEPPADLGYYQRLSQPTFTINSLTCQDAGDHRTVIPNVAVAKCDMRLVGGQRAQDVIAAIRAHVAAHDPQIEITVGGVMQPQRTPPETPYTQAIIRGARAGLGETPLLIPALGGSLPIAEFAGPLDLPCYGMPLANADENNHAPNENMEIGRFLRGIRGAAGILLALNGAL